MACVPREQAPAVHHRRFGDIVVTTILDGYIDVGTEVFNNISSSEMENELKGRYANTVPRITVNAYLVRSGNRTALIEAGSGTTLGPTLGKLQSNLLAAGVSPEEVDTVLVTHMHPDHSNGLTDSDGNRVFPNAELRMHELERSHWLDDARFARAEGRQVLYFETARERLKAYGANMNTFTGGEVFPGIHADPIGGHTPGHTGFRVGAGKDSLFIWGDIVHLPEIQISRPEVSTTMDTDANAAVETRRRVLDMVSSERQLVAGMHIGFPGYGYVERRRGGYHFHPAGWTLEF